MRERPTIRLFKGDITNLEVDGIVNAANNKFIMGGGVAAAIKKRGGEEIEKEAIKKGPVNVGEAIVTNAGTLKVKVVIHAAVMGEDFKTDAKIIETATLNSFIRAEELNLETVAFPALGTGVGRFSMEECAQIMIRAAREHIQGPTSLKEIIFVLYDNESYSIFERILKEKTVL